MTAEFSHNGFIYRYDFDALAFEQIMLGESISNFHNNQLRKPAKSLREFELSEGQTWLHKLFSYILVKVGPDGNPVPWAGRQTAKETAAFVGALPGSQWAGLMECKSDFFSRANIVDVESLLQLTPLIEGLGSASTQTAEPQNDDADTASNGSETNDSGDEVNSIDD